MVSSSSPVNPILNNPYEEPTAHYNVADSGEVGVAQLREGRRPFTHDVSAVPVPAKQLSAFGTTDFAAAYENQLVNLLRGEMEKWRTANYPGTTAITRILLFHWFGNPLSSDPLNRDNPRKLFFAQREAIETAIWLTEIAPTAANVGAHVLNILRDGRDKEHLPDTQAYVGRISYQLPGYPRGLPARTPGTRHRRGGFERRAYAPPTRQWVLG